MFHFRQSYELLKDNIIKPYLSNNNCAKIVDVGSYEELFALYSTISVRLDSQKEFITNALRFLKTGNSEYKDSLIIAREFNLIRDMLSNVSISELVYDMRDISKKAPWLKNISSVVTSCGNFFITRDGKDTLYEIVSLFVYSYYNKVNVTIGG